MDFYTVIKTINGRRYRYRQRTWRENGRVRTKSEYVGPVVELLRELVRKPEQDVETDAQARERVALEDAERARHSRVNDLLTAPTISVEALGEIVDLQNEGEPAGSPEGSTE